MSRVSFSCTMQEGQVADDVRAKLADGLRQVTADVLGEAPDDECRSISPTSQPGSGSAAASRPRHPWFGAASSAASPRTCAKT